MNHKQQGFVFRCERQLHKEFEFISRFASQRLNNGPPPPGAGSCMLSHARTHTHTHTHTYTYTHIHVSLSWTSAQTVYKQTHSCILCIKHPGIHTFALALFDARTHTNPHATKGLLYLSVCLMMNNVNLRYSVIFYRATVEWSYQGTTF